MSCGPLLAPDIPFLAHLRRAVAPDALVEVAVRWIEGGAAWVKVLADAPGPDANMLAATPTYDKRCSSATSTPSPRC